MSESTAVEQRRDQAPALIQQIDQVMPQLERLGVDPDRFARVLLSECRANPRLLECTPASFMGAAFSSAQLGLEPGPLQQVWLIPRRNKRRGTTDVQFMIGYRGYVELARRVGVLVTANTVHANDHFAEQQGSDPKLEHVPNHADPGEPILWYAVARFPDGRSIHRVLNKDAVERRRKMSSTPYKPGSPWYDHYDAMACKTCIRALWSELPADPRLQDAQRLDEQVLTMPSVDGPAVPAIAGSQTTDVPAVAVGGGDPLDTATLNDLRQACGDAGLDKDGDRAELVARLKAARDAAASGSSTLNEEPETGSPSQRDDQPASTDGPPVPPPPDDPAGDAHVPGPAPASSAEPVEDDTSDPEAAMTEAQRRNLFRLFGDHGITDEQRKAVVVGHYGLQSMNELTVGQAVKLIDLLEQPDGPAKFAAAADEWLAAGDEAAVQPREPDDSSAGVDGEATSAEDTTPEPEPEPEPDLGADLAARAYERSKGATPIGQQRRRIFDAWGVLAQVDREVYAASIERVTALVGGKPAAVDWTETGVSEVVLRREAEDLERRVRELEAAGKVR